MAEAVHVREPADPWIVYPAAHDTEQSCPVVSPLQVAKLYSGDSLGRVQVWASQTGFVPDNSVEGWQVNSLALLIPT
jgi:hypothetical protein